MTEQDEMSENEFAPVTPGEMLKDEFLAEYRLSQSRLARAVGISPNRIAEIVNNRRRITADTALRLAHELQIVFLDPKFERVCAV